MDAVCLSDTKQLINQLCSNCVMTYRCNNKCIMYIIKNRVFEQHGSTWGVGTQAEELLLHSILQGPTPIYFYPLNSYRLVERSKRKHYFIRDSF